MVTLKLLNKHINDNNISTEELLILSILNSLPNNSLSIDYINQITHMSKYKINKTIKSLLESNVIEKTKYFYSIKTKKTKTTKEKIICLDTNEKYRSYNRYLKSAHWKSMKYQYYKMYNYKCALCKKCFVWRPSLLNLHHKTYAHIGNELPNELVLLCKNCHTKIHKNPKLYKQFFI